MEHGQRPPLCTEALQNASLERHAFRIDVCGHQYSVPSEQMDAQLLDHHLLQLSQPFNQSICALSVDLAPLIADSIEALLESVARTPHDASPSSTASMRPSSNRRRRCSSTASPAKMAKPPRLLRKRISLLSSVAMAEQQSLASSFWDLLCNTSSPVSGARNNGPLAGIHDAMALLASEVHDKMPDPGTSSAGAIAQVARTFGVSAQPTSNDDVIEFVASPVSQECASDSVVGIYTTRDDAERPFSTGLIEYLISGMNRHARTHLNVRHAWALVLAPGIMRYCLVESDAIHMSSAHDLATAAGRRALVDFYTNACLAEPWRLGADPTMRWQAAIGRWEIECPNADDVSRRHRRTTRNSLAVQQATTVVYAQRAPLFVADSFFGRFTRCFPVSMTPDGPLDQVLKDSWQLVSADCDSVDDEISVLRHIRRCLDSARPAAGAVYPRITCGGTVRISTGASAVTTRDTSHLILDELDAYARWTVPHGFRKLAPGSEPAGAQPQKLQRLHRRMVTGPIGIPIQTLSTEQEVITVLADAMQSHADILHHAGILHRDISLNNIMAARTAQGELRGMLIDFDHAIDLAAERNQQTPGNVGTGPFMSISNLEGLDVARTAVDDWESLICLLFCLAANGPPAMDELGRLFGHVNGQGVADMKREIFASPRALDYAIDRYLNPSYHTIIRTIRALYVAAFQHSRCQGTARIFLRGNRNVDPVLRRAQYADEIQARCMGALASIALEIRSMSSLSDHLATISHECCDLKWHQHLYSMDGGPHHHQVPSMCNAPITPGEPPSDPTTATEESAQRAVAERLAGMISAVTSQQIDHHHGAEPRDSCSSSNGEGDGADDDDGGGGGGDTTAVSCKSLHTLDARRRERAHSNGGADSLGNSATPPPEPMTAKSEGQANGESNASLATLLRETSDLPKYGTHTSQSTRFLPPYGGGHSTSSTLTDLYSSLKDIGVTQDNTQHGPPNSVNNKMTAQLMALVQQEEQALLRNKRKAKEEQQDSPRTKRRKMIHQDVDCGNFELSPMDGGSPRPQHRRALTFGSPVNAHSPLRSPYSRRHRRPPIRSAAATPSTEIERLGLPVASTKLKRKLF
ncbi:hypothetical protein LPJ74_006231 [Coemansia sp. RSA 1843]|nr:hypothetical protein LPJ74_006231 [Coemansia sp. RSA 1843]